MEEPLHHLGARESLALMTAHGISAADMAKAFGERIAAREADIRAWAYCDPEAVMRRAEQGDTMGALDGLLIGIKDNFDTADMPTAYGSRFYEGHRPASDAAAVAILRANGAILAGKTVCTEFAAWPVSKTRNPHSSARTPGGSSSGSAAAVADHMISVALGTQTLGSVVRPASYCGVVGFKPSYGRISRVGVKPLAESLDTVGVLSRNVGDAELIYRVLSGDERRASASPRIHVCRGLNWDLADEDAKAAFEAFVAKLGAAVALKDWHYPGFFTQLAAAARTIHDFEVYRGFTFERTSAPEKLSPSFVQGLERGRGCTAPDYEAAVEQGRDGRNQFVGEMGDGSVVITLSATGEAPAYETGTGDPVFNSSWTLLHAPCLTIPVLAGASGMPIGLQIVAPKFRDAEVLHAAAWLHDFARGL
ncbi:amidase [Aquabacter sp. CN5-332]|uniref:amidase n=1 Tax=Aquabacter sp. CN5-332 TaxID=3156608 RepID=UPI0032B394D4